LFELLLMSLVSMAEVLFELLLMSLVSMAV
jgi:hypothetical protein